VAGRGGAARELWAGAGGVKTQAGRLPGSPVRTLRTLPRFCLHVTRSVTRFTRFARAARFTPFFTRFTRFTRFSSPLARSARMQVGFPASTAPKSGRRKAPASDESETSDEEMTPVEAARVINYLEDTNYRLRKKVSRPRLWALCGRWLLGSSGRLP
jgi:hypothetical protein